MPTPDRSHALDHVVLVLFENRSFDNMLGHLYGPEDGKNFDGVIGKNLSNPIPEWAEHSAERKTVPYTVASFSFYRGPPRRVLADHEVVRGRRPRTSVLCSKEVEGGLRPHASVDLDRKGGDSGHRGTAPQRLL